MSSRSFLTVILFLVTIAGSLHARFVNIELEMPSSVFYPGEIFSLNLAIDNRDNSDEIEATELFVVLYLGGNNYFFLPFMVCLSRIGF